MPSAQFDRTWPQSPAPWASCRGYHSLVRIVLALYPNTACIPKIDDERMSIHLWKLTLNPNTWPTCSMNIIRRSIFVRRPSPSGFDGYPLVSSNPGPLMHLQVTHFPAWHWAIRKLEQLAKAQVPPVKPQRGDCCSCPKDVAYVGKPKRETFC